MVYKCFVFAGQEDFLSNILRFSNVGSMLGQHCRRWPNNKTVLGECLVGVVSRLLIRLLNQPHSTVCWLYQHTYGTLSLILEATRVTLNTSSIIEYVYKTIPTNHVQSFVLK